MALQKRGHEVEVFTSYHEDGAKGRSFDETRNGAWAAPRSSLRDEQPPEKPALTNTRAAGTLTVHVLGNSIFPRSIFGRFTIICAMLRQLHLVFSFLLAAFLYHASSWPLLSLFALPVETPFRSSSDWSPRRQLEPFDVIVIDQLSTGIPLLRWFGGNRVVFYCHFPDQLLSPSSSAALSSPHDPRAGTPFSIAAEVRKTYRAPIDALEQATTGEADKILVNSEFTAQVFERTFPALRRQPRVVYPSVDLQQYGKEVEKVEEQDRWLVRCARFFFSVSVSIALMATCSPQR